MHSPIQLLLTALIATTLVQSTAVCPWMAAAAPNLSPRQPLVTTGVRVALLHHMSDHVTLLLKTLQRLPISHRATAYKVCCAPAPLATLWRHLPATSPSLTLRQPGWLLCYILSTRGPFPLGSSRDRPSAWNAHPQISAPPSSLCQMPRSQRSHPLSSCPGPPHTAVLFLFSIAFFTQQDTKQFSSLTIFIFVHLFSPTGRHCSWGTEIFVCCVYRCIPNA